MARYTIRWEKAQLRYVVVDRVGSRVVASFNHLSQAEAFVLDQQGGER